MSYVGIRKEGVSKSKQVKLEEFYAVSDLTKLRLFREQKDQKKGIQVLTNQD